MNIAIVGLGYVGTVSAACFACRKHSVWGVDINTAKVDAINAGRSPIVERDLGQMLAAATAAGRLSATTEIAGALGETEICLVAVATPSLSNGMINSSHLFRACRQIASALAELGRPQLIAIRSSVLPSVFEQCRAIFDSVAPGLIELCANPEFLREGTAIRDFENPPFTVIGTESATAEQALRTLYSDVAAPVLVLRPAEALMLKYASNAYHALKVAFGNEIGELCRRLSVDPEPVMHAFCSDTKLNISKRYLMPGFAFGGSCLPKDIRAIQYAARQVDFGTPLASAILTSNMEVIDRAVESILSSGPRRAGLIGLAFKPDTDDLRESPYVMVAERLLGKGISLKIYDPNVLAGLLTGANKDYINRVIPHLSRLLVSSLEEIANVELVVVGHRYEGVDRLLERTPAPVFDLNAPPLLHHLEIAGFAAA
jgi:GDP-mannose 6-dehydrogenase